MRGRRRNFPSLFALPLRNNLFFHRGNTLCILQPRRKDQRFMGLPPPKDSLTKPPQCVCPACLRRGTQYLLQTLSGALCAYIHLEKELLSSFVITIIAARTYVTLSPQTGARRVGAPIPTRHGL